MGLRKVPATVPSENLCRYELETAGAPPDAWVEMPGKRLLHPGRDGFSAGKERTTDMKVPAQKQALILGVPVNSREGRIGRVSKLILQRESMRPSYLIVELSGSLRQVVVPVELVEAVRSGGVELKASQQEVWEQPDSESILQVEEAGGSQHRLAKLKGQGQSGYLRLKEDPAQSRLAVVQAGLPLLDCHDEQVGEVEGIVFEVGSRRGKYILFSRAGKSQLQLAPASLVAEAHLKGIWLIIDEPLILKLPAYTIRLASQWGGQ
jgi:hypothetical protein